MVNCLEALINPLLHGLMKMASLRHQTVEVEPGTLISFWSPKERRKKHKPSVVLIHGFAGDGVLTWLFQVLALTSKYSVYVPDLLFFGGSITNNIDTIEDRSPKFQAEFLIKALDEKLGVDACTVVGFSYGAMVAFMMAEMRPDLVKSLVISGMIVTITDSIHDAILERLGFSSWADLLLPESVEGLKAMLSVGAYKKFWFPDFLYRDYLQIMFNNRKERAELLERMDITNTTDGQMPKLQQAARGKGYSERNKEGWPPRTARAPLHFQPLPQGIPSS